jgi:DNA-binding IclR family transcriptional regulator
MDKTLLKGLRLLEILAASDRSMGVTEIALLMNIAKSNAHRILQTLVAAGFAAPAVEVGRYRLTLKLWSLGTAVAVSTDMRKLSAPILGRLRDVTGETAFLAVLDGSEVTYVEILPSVHAIRVHTTVGDRMPAYCTSAGKILLAFNKSSHNTPEGIALSGEFKKILRQMYAINCGAYRPEVSGIAVPVIGADGKVIASVGISGPSDRFRTNAIKDWLPAVVQAGLDISHMMGAKP